MPELILVSCKYFSSLIYYIKTYFEKQGITCIDVDIIDPFNPSMHLIFDIRDRACIPLNFLVYNFEQLEASNLSDMFYSKLGLAKHIFDYSQNNVEFLSNMNIAATFMPYSWFPSLRTVTWYIPMQERKCSFMFVGYFNERRRNLLKPIHENAKNNMQKMLISSNLWGPDYTKHTSNTKISLNIHCYEEHTILEVHRIITCILDKNLVLTERSADPYYDELLDGCVTWINKANVIEMINNTLTLDGLELDTIVTERLKHMLCKMKIFSNILDEHKTKIINEITQLT
jgi:hypothetical protein